MQGMAPGGAHDPPEHGRNHPQALTEETFGSGAGDPSPWIPERGGDRCSGTPPTPASDGQMGECGAAQPLLLGLQTG